MSSCCHTERNGGRKGYILLKSPLHPTKALSHSELLHLCDRSDSKKHTTLGYTCTRARARGRESDEIHTSQHHHCHKRNSAFWVSQIHFALMHNSAQLTKETTDIPQKITDIFPKTRDISKKTTDFFPKTRDISQKMSHVILGMCAQHHKKAQKANRHLEQRKESCKFVAELRTRTDLTACNLKKKC